MNSADLVKAGKVKTFWNAYRACVEAHHIPPERSGFYVRWVQEFVDFQPEIKLRDRSAADIERFLKFLGEQAGMADWQVKQAAYALRLLYEQFLPAYHPGTSGGAMGTAGPQAFRDRVLPGEAERRRGPLLQQLRTEARERHYSYKTETAYLDWVRRFLAFHQYADPRQLTPATAIKDYLDYLAGVRYVSASTQNQALNALVFLYGQVLHVPVGDLGDFQRAKRSRVINYLSVALGLGESFAGGEPSYLPVPAELEREAAPTQYRWIGSRAMGQLHIARLDRGEAVPLLPVDVAAWQTTRVADTMTFLCESSRASFPMRGYPQPLIEAHAHAHLGGLEVEMLEETLLVQLADRHPAVAAQARRLRLLGRQLAEEITEDNGAPSP